MLLRDREEEATSSQAAVAGRLFSRPRHCARVAVGGPSPQGACHQLQELGIVLFGEFTRVEMGQIVMGSAGNGARRSDAWTAGSSQRA